MQWKYAITLGGPHPRKRLSDRSSDFDFRMYYEQAARKLADCGAAGSIVVILPDRGDRYFSKDLI